MCASGFYLGDPAEGRLQKSVPSGLTKSKFERDRKRINLRIGTQKVGGVMLLIHKDISHMPITELENDSESVWVKVFTNKTSHFVASWYQPPGRNLAELTSEIGLLRSQLQKFKCMHKGNNPPPPPPPPPPQSMFLGNSTSETLFGQTDLTNRVHR